MMKSTLEDVRHSGNRSGRLAAVVAGLSLLLAPSVFATFLNLGSVADYAVAGVGGSVSVQSEFEIYQSATVINGNVAQGPYTTLTHGIDATVNGRWDYDLTDSNPAASGFTGTVTGGFHQINLAGMAADARAASTTAAAFAPTQTFASLDQFDGVGAIIGGPGLNVIRVTGDSTIKNSLTLQGTATSQFLFQFTSPTTTGHDILSLSGATMNIGTINPDNIVWNFNGLGGDLNINAMAAGQKVYGNFLAPERNILSDHGIVEGRLIGGGSGQELSIHSGSEITQPPTGPPPVIPEPTTMLFGVALVGFMGASRRRSR